MEGRKERGGQSTRRVKYICLLSVIEEFVVLTVVLCSVNTYAMAGNNTRCNWKWSMMPLRTVNIVILHDMGFNGKGHKTRRSSLLNNKIL